MLKIAYNLLFNFQRLFKPNYMIHEFANLLLIEEFDNQIKYIVFDKDDTLVPLHTFDIKDPSINNVVQKFRAKGIQMVIVSNSLRKNIPQLPADMKVNGIPIFLTQSKKPFNGQQIKQYLQSTANKQKIIENNQIAIVGDRLLTDVHLGKLMGWNSILIDPLQASTIGKHGLPVYLMRHIEKLIVKIGGFQYFRV